MQPIELRSDTFTRPTPAMLQAMMAARVGDDVFGEDPTVNELEALAADMFGIEAALFCPSGTMTNQIGINVHTRPGDEVICEEHAHVYFYEGGGIAKNSGASVRLLQGDRGRISAAQVEAAVNPDDVHRPRTRLVCLENTCNRGGGSTYSMPAMQEIREVGNRHGLALHLDGARLFNAMVANGEDTREYGRIFHSISVCLSKGLGAPVGSLLLGERDYIHQARRVRKVLGGGMRQAGYLAAAGIYALNNHVQRLHEDHEHARMLADTLKQCSWVEQVLPVETNIVIFGVKQPAGAPEVVQRLRQQGVHAAAVGPAQIRFVTHLDVRPEQIQRVCGLLPGLMG